ncbi:MAG: HAD family phosphatase [Rhodothermales bacterium]
MIDLGACEAVLFDLDGTLVDSEPLHERAIQQVCDPYGVVLAPDDYVELKGATTYANFAYIIERYRLAEVTVEQMVNAKRAIFPTLLQQALTPIPGADAFLRDVKARVSQVGLVTTSPRHTQHMATEHFGWTALFDTIVTVDDVTQAKPHPEPYQTAAARLQVAPARCLVLEDSISGIRSAVATGATVVALTTSFAEPQVLEAGATLAVDGYTALRHHLGL